MAYVKDMCGDMLLMRTIVSIVRRKLGDEADNPHLHLHRAPRRLPDADGRDAETRRGRGRAQSRGWGYCAAPSPRQPHTAQSLFIASSHRYVNLPRRSN